RRSDEKCGRLARRRAARLTLYDRAPRGLWAASMGAFRREELEDAFRIYWRTGAVGEDWNAWADLFTEDCTYFEHWYGLMHGREAAMREYEAACQRDDPDHPKKRTRLDWGNGPAWTKGGRSWFERPRP